MMDDGAQSIAKSRVKAFIQVLPAGENWFDRVCCFHKYSLFDTCECLSNPDLILSDKKTINQEIAKI